jgi:hypothetical protein
MFIKFLKKLISIFKNDAFAEDLQRIADLVTYALPYVQRIAEASATKTDDEFLAYLKEILEGDATGNIHDMMHKAVAVFMRRVGLKDPDRFIDAAIPLAYAAFRRGERVP